MPLYWRPSKPSCQLTFRVANCICTALPETDWDSGPATLTSVLWESRFVPEVVCFFRLLACWV